jgi:hypothetical protein
VHHSRTTFCRAVPNPTSITIRPIPIAVGGVAAAAAAAAGSSSLLQKLNLPLLLEQTLHVSVSSHCASRPAMCEPPRVLSVAAYRGSDVSLKQFLAAALPARVRRCVSNPPLPYPPLSPLMGERREPQAVPRSRAACPRAPLREQPTPPLPPIEPIDGGAT